MDTFLGILLLAAVVVVIIFVQKIIGTTVSAVSKNVLYRSEYREGQELVSETLNFETSAPIDQIMAALTSTVTVAEMRAVKAVVYESSRSDNRVTYAFGSSLSPKNFEAEVALTEHTVTTEGHYTILSWKETVGLVAAQEAMKKLRRQARGAFTLADSQVRIQTTSSNEE